MKYQLVMFDFDGTLADSFPWFAHVINGVADRYNFKRIDRQDIETLRGYGPRQIMQHLGVPWWKLPLIARHMRALLARDIEQIALFDGVDQMLQTLRQRGVITGLVTSNADANARRVLGPHNAALIDYYECNVSLFGKPKRLQRILQQTGTLPHQALYVGDELRDGEAAHRVGIRFGAVAWGFTHIDALQRQQPAELFARVADIAECIG